MRRHQPTTQQAAPHGLPPLPPARTPQLRGEFRAGRLNYFLAAVLVATVGFLGYTYLHTTVTAIPNNLISDVAATATSVQTGTASPVPVEGNRVSVVPATAGVDGLLVFGLNDRIRVCYVWASTTQVIAPCDYKAYTGTLPQ